MADKNEIVEPASAKNSNFVDVTMDIDNNKDATETSDNFEFKTPVSNSNDGFKMPSIQFKIPDKHSLVSPITKLDKQNKSPVAKKPTKPTDIQPPPPKPQTAKSSSALPSEKLQQTQAIFPYKEPTWSGMPDPGYSFEVLKNGSIVENIELKEKPYYVFGRLPSCDVTMEHPSLSRYHAVVQYCKNPESSESESGWYLYDLDSTHGTWLNKNKVRPNMYHRIRVGHVVKFGGSTRLHILQGPESDQDEESELSVTEIKQQRDKQKREAEVLRLADAEQTDRVRQQITQDGGCSWGMGDDAVEDPEEEGGFLTTQPDNEELYIEDPKKALKGFYEREGCDLPEYIITDLTPGKYKCRVDLPVDGQHGEPLSAVVEIAGKKKEAVIACALEACKLLDRHQLLRQAKHESHKKKSKNWEADDFYDSDEDTFLDRTGTIEKKRNKRMIKAGKIDSKGESYDSLLEKHQAVVTETEEIEAKLAQAKAEAAAYDGDDIDALDAYMSAIKAGVMDTKTKMTLKRRLIVLRTEEMRLRRLVNIAKPATLPELKQPLPVTKKTSVDSLKGLTGHKPIRKSLPKSVSRVPAISHDGEMEEEEEEEEESEDEENENNLKSKNITDLKSDTKSLTVPSDSNKQTNIPSEKDRVKLPEKKKSNISALSSVLEQLQNEIPESEEPKILNTKSKPKMKGPARPSSDDSNSETKGRKRLSGEDGGQQGKKKVKNGSSMEADSTDPDYASWLPPTGQSGDGKTHLNDKFGY